MHTNDMTSNITVLWYAIQFLHIASHLNIKFMLYWNVPAELYPICWQTC